MAKIICPKCRRILGDTHTSLDCNLNCKWCKQAVPVKMVMAQTTDYFKKERSKND